MRTTRRGRPTLESLPPHVFWTLATLGGIAVTATLLAVAVWWPPSRLSRLPRRR